jgi:penicillin-binding protein 2
MEGVTLTGTAKVLATSAYRVPGVRIAGKTGTAQVVRPWGKVDEAWFICFAPLENPTIAIAVAVDGTNPGENFQGGIQAAPIAAQILKKYFEKQRGAVAAN